MTTASLRIMTRLWCVACASAASIMAGLAPAPALAGNLSLLVNGKAIHLDVPAGQHYNEENWGVGLQYDFETVGEKWIPFANASEFLDSNNNVSYYAGGGIVRRFAQILGTQDGYVDLGIVAFAMHREGFRDGDLFPGILPVVSVGSGRVALNITYIPKVDPKMVALFFFQLKIGLN